MALGAGVQRRHPAAALTGAAQTAAATRPLAPPPHRPSRLSHWLLSASLTAIRFFIGSRRRRSRNGVEQNRRLLPSALSPPRALGKGRGTLTSRGARYCDVTAAGARAGRRGGRARARRAGATQKALRGIGVGEGNRKRKWGRMGLRAEGGQGLQECGQGLSWAGLGLSAGAEPGRTWPGASMCKRWRRVRAGNRVWFSAWVWVCPETRAGPRLDQGLKDGERHHRGSVRAIAVLCEGGRGGLRAWGAERE